jgi:hypothetical protein
MFRHSLISKWACACFTRLAHIFLFFSFRI